MKREDAPTDGAVVSALLQLLDTWAWRRLGLGGLAAMQKASVVQASRRDPCWPSSIPRAPDDERRRVRPGARDGTADRRREVCSDVVVDRARCRTQNSVNDLLARDVARATERRTSARTRSSGASGSPGVRQAAESGRCRAAVALWPRRLRRRRAGGYRFRRFSSPLLFCNTHKRRRRSMHGASRVPSRLPRTSIWVTSPSALDFVGRQCRTGMSYRRARRVPGPPGSPGISTPPALIFAFSHERPCAAGFRAQNFACRLVSNPAGHRFHNHTTPSGLPWSLARAAGASILLITRATAASIPPSSWRRWLVPVGDPCGRGCLRCSAAEARHRHRARPDARRQRGPSYRARRRAVLDVDRVPGACISEGLLRSPPARHALGAAR